MVGAPLSNVTADFGNEDRIRYGAVYRCEYPGGQCNVINIDNRGKCIVYAFSDT